MRNSIWDLVHPTNRLMMTRSFLLLPRAGKILSSFNNLFTFPFASSFSAFDIVDLVSSFSLPILTLGQHPITYRGRLTVFALFSLPISHGASKTTIIITTVVLTIQFTLVLQHCWPYGHHRLVSTNFPRKSHHHHHLESLSPSQQQQQSEDGSGKTQASEAVVEDAYSSKEFSQPSSSSFYDYEASSSTTSATTTTSAVVYFSAENERKQESSPLTIFQNGEFHLT